MRDANGVHQYLVAEHGSIPRAKVFSCLLRGVFKRVILWRYRQHEYVKRV